MCNDKKEFPLYFSAEPTSVGQLRKRFRKNIGAKGGRHEALLI